MPTLSYRSGYGNRVAICIVSAAARLEARGSTWKYRSPRREAATGRDLLHGEGIRRWRESGEPIDGAAARAKPLSRASGPSGCRSCECLGSQAFLRAFENGARKRQPFTPNQILRREFSLCYTARVRGIRLGHMLRMELPSCSAR